MVRLMLIARVAGAALFAGAVLAQAQSPPPPEPPPEAAQIPTDEGYSVDVPARPTHPAVPASDDDAEGY